MDNKNQVTNLELSKELKENGYPQEGWWYWIQKSDFGDLLDGFWIKLGGPEGTYRDGVYQGKEQYFVAPTVAELGEVLPVQFNDFGWYDLKIHKCMAKWEIEYIKYNMNDNNCLVEGDYYFKVKDKSLADCMAKTWLYLKKNGLLED